MFTRYHPNQLTSLFNAHYITTATISVATTSKTSRVWATPEGHHFQGVLTGSAGTCVRLLAGIWFEIGSHRRRPVVWYYCEQDEGSICLEMRAHLFCAWCERVLLSSN